ncbi:MAM domain-containing glycosylphosphatidylinositol anchor protein 2-like [Mytilus californianus]|uniref:MAM domain-containing glycosylphosphatidylinositol anchor protein 2-like n=1 Tax=Mytilus californianus TaxID=6549 RepID=UPI002247E24F|nr:MAM domain-containing glycosylphosphatidylinositol anchor protein 2-like [Mytilus californianus]
MYGRHINTLKVFQVKNTRLIELWRKSANQGNKWHFQSLSLNDIGRYQIMFRATRGNGYKSEIAVDDIFINNSECKKVNGTSVTSDSTTTGLVVGLVIGGLLLACVVIVIALLIRRYL